MTAPRSLEARGLSFRRGLRLVLDGASLTVSPGELVAIQGRSGSGKSTFVRLLAGLAEPNGGDILLGGVPVSAISPFTYRRAVAYLAQRPAMLPGTVTDNVRAGPALHGKTLEDAQIAALLAAVELGGELGERQARTLSGGEMQRVALARALANEPEIVLLDEPTAALDPEAGERIVALLRTLPARGRSVVMVTHVEAHARDLGGSMYTCLGGRLERRT